ncbi:hypothetical protein A3A70_02350 [candidate division WWE3 bacterium RIFCSPLOWO2_01_FULL_42_11]|uniref:Uncharacterized protein n=1 Tax=candidate division WWE3 bacterium RIFCSPLOWO2_01_FULL_42_11 TaxID=1802627 RepID=A0A1F4VRV2_UNCKA|nr:MAG: hypothetical protein A3A70_02350 [candidate division WWE3 bacterium RIFCSPLOWO2_01_FULL_42_11]
MRPTFVLPLLVVIVLLLLLLDIFTGGLLYKEIRSPKTNVPNASNNSDKQGSSSPSMQYTNPEDKGLDER